MQQIRNDKSAFGFIYILSNHSMPDLKKVGRTERHPEIRAAELSKHSGIPTEFNVVFYIEVYDMYAAENRIHSALSQFRCNNDREFFKAPLLVIVDVIKENLYELIPEESPFRSHLDNFRAIIMHKKEKTEIYSGLCPKCNGKLIDEIDQASMESDRVLMLRIKDRERNIILKIKDTLGRFEDGTFGICEECGEEIPTKRLMARPVTSLCIECKKSQEAAERVREFGL